MSRKKLLFRAANNFFQRITNALSASLKVEQRARRAFAAKHVLLAVLWIGILYIGGGQSAIAGAGAVQSATPPTANILTDARALLSDYRSRFPMEAYESINRSSRELVLPTVYDVSKFSLPISAATTDGRQMGNQPSNHSQSDRNDNGTGNIKFYILLGSSSLLFVLLWSDLYGHFNF